MVTTREKGRTYKKSWRTVRFHPLVDNQLDQAEDSVGEEDEGKDHESEQKGCGHFFQDISIQETHGCPSGFVARIPCILLQRAG